MIDFNFVCKLSFYLIIPVIIIFLTICNVNVRLIDLVIIFLVALMSNEIIFLLKLS